MHTSIYTTGCVIYDSWTVEVVALVLAMHSDSPNNDNLDSLMIHGTPHQDELPLSVKETMRMLWSNLAQGIL